MGASLAFVILLQFTAIAIENKTNKQKIYIYIYVDVYINGKETQ